MLATSIKFSEEETLAEFLHRFSVYDLGKAGFFSELSHRVLSGAGGDPTICFYFEGTPGIETVSGFH